MQLTKTANRMAKIITLSVCKKFKQQSLFRTNLATLNDGGISPSVVVAGFQFCLIQYGGQKTESLRHCEMNSVHVIFKQPTLRALLSSGVLIMIKTAQTP